MTLQLQQPAQYILWDSLQILGALNNTPLPVYNLGANNAYAAFRITNVSPLWLRMLNGGGGQIDAIAPFTIASRVYPAADFSFDQDPLFPPIASFSTAASEYFPTFVIKFQPLTTPIIASSDYNLFPLSAALIQNASIDVAGSVQADITNASLPVSGSVDVGNVVDMNLSTSSITLPVSADVPGAVNVQNVAGNVLDANISSSSITMPVSGTVDIQNVSGGTIDVNLSTSSITLDVNATVPGAVSVENVTGNVLSTGLTQFSEGSLTIGTGGTTAVSVTVNIPSNTHVLALGTGGLSSVTVESLTVTGVQSGLTYLNLQLSGIAASAVSEQISYAAVLSGVDSSATITVTPTATNAGGGTMDIVAILGVEVVSVQGDNEHPVPVVNVQSGGIPQPVAVDLMGVLAPSTTYSNLSAIGGSVQNAGVNQSVNGVGIGSMGTNPNNALGQYYGYATYEGSGIFTFADAGTVSSASLLRSVCFAALIQNTAGTTEATDVAFFAYRWYDSAGTATYIWLATIILTLPSSGQNAFGSGSSVMADYATPLSLPPSASGQPSAGFIVYIQTPTGTPPPFNGVATFTAVIES